MTPSQSLALPLEAAPCCAGIDQQLIDDRFDAVRLRSRDGFEATFVPKVGMTCCSLRYGDVELLGERWECR
jgi:hypothetical protein